MNTTPSKSIVRARWVVRGVKELNGRPFAEVLHDGAVVHSGGRIVDVGSFDAMHRAHPDAQVIHHAAHMLLPGFVNGHHHVGVTPLQAGAPDMALEMWWAARIGTRNIDAYLDTLYSAFEMIASGITTVQHIHGWMSGGYEEVYGASTAILDAYRAIGMRASYCYAVREQNLLVYEDDARFCERLPVELARPMRQLLAGQAMSFTDQLRLYGQLRDENAGAALTRIQLAPANLHWMTDDGISAMAERARADGVPAHMHLVETAYQREYARRRTGTTAVSHLDRLGALGPWMTLGHGVWLTDEDIGRIAQTGTCICHNCSSNFRLRSGIARLNEFAAQGITVGLGLDEAGINDDRDMLQEMRLALRVHRTPGMDESEVPNCAQVLRMATEHGARTTPFGDSIGRLDPGRHFDAVAINYETAIYPFQDEDIPALDALIQRARTRDVDTVYIGGDAVYAHGRFKHVDRDSVMEQVASQLASPRTPEEDKRRWLSKAVLPHVRSFYDGYLPKEGAARV